MATMIIICQAFYIIFLIFFSILALKSMINISRSFFFKHVSLSRIRTNGLRKLRTITIFCQGTEITVLKRVKFNKSCVSLHFTFKT